MSVFRLSVGLLPKHINKGFKVHLNAVAPINSLLPGSSTLFVSVNNNYRMNQRNYSSLQKSRQYAKPTVAVMQNSRSISTQDITKNIQLLTEKPRNVDKDPETFKLKHSVEKPLVILLSWLLAKQKHLEKYAQIYIEQGFDVLTISISPWQLLWPAKGSQLVAADLLKLLENNHSYNPILLHGFSVGGYFWGECMVQMAKDTTRYQLIIDRICGQIWDSAAGITEIPIGVPKAMFNKNDTLQKALRSYMIYHMKAFHEVATQHYIRSNTMFHDTMVRAPALFLLSKNDPVGSVASNQVLRDHWEALNIQVTWKCWEKSAHVGHFRRHKEEYLEALFNHLQLVNLVRYQEKLRAKL